MAGQDRLKGVQFTGEPSTSGRVLAPVPTLFATHSRGNHGGIAPTESGL
ncbi:thioredoxin [Prochlorothrix hollandica]|nr:thioredoxin [Prochlorothrix hollandica]